ncbi:MAG: choice-of-anchor D domain-containing protein [Edaphobacter sp.]
MIGTYNPMIPMSFPCKSYLWVLRVLSSLVVGVLGFTISGCNSGTAPASPSAPGVPQVTLGTLSAFPSTTVGVASTAQSVTLTNSGNASLSLTGISIMGANASSFAESTTCGNLLAAGNTCAIVVTFTPSTAGALTAAISVADDASGSPQTVAISGTGTLAPIPQAVFSPATLSFPGTTVGVTSAAQIVTLSNPGTTPLSISGITITGANNVDFAETNTCGASLVAGGTCTISVTFIPATPGSLAASISVADNASGSPQTVALTGTATAVPTSQAVLSPVSLSFPTTSIGSAAAAQSITVSNPGTAILNISNIAITGTNSSSFSETDNCDISLAPNASCTISATFSPSAGGSLTAAVSVADDATGSPQTATLSGTGTIAQTPQAVFSPTSVAFLNTAVGSTSAPQTLTLSNPGAMPLNLSAITLTGTNPTSFSSTGGTCGTTVAPGGSCTIALVFNPVAAASYSANLSVADNVAGSPQLISLTGTGVPASSTSLTLLTFPESDLSVTPVYNYINTATQTLDMTMYELVDTTFQQDLAALAAKGVKVRVILDQSLEKSSNTAAYNYLNANGVQAVWANSGFQACHQKTITIDGKSTMIMTLNLTSRYYNDTRDFAVIDTSPNDVAAIETVFNSDFANGATNFATPDGDDLIWSPTNSQTALVALINSAKVSLNIENEEMSDTAIVNALAAAATRGVHVQVTMTSDGSYNKEFTTLKTAGAQVHTYAESAPLYIHAKVVVVDYGQTAGQQAFVGSENFTNASLNQNRELGLTLTDSTTIQSLNTTLNSDFAGGTPF